MESDGNDKKNLKKARKAAYYKKNREKVLAAVKSYRIKNRDLICLKSREKYHKNKSFYRARGKAYYEKNKEKFLRACKVYHIKNRDKLLAHMRAKYQKNREYRVARQKAYYQKNKQACLQRAKDYAARNRDKVLAMAKANRLRNIEKVRAQDRERSKKDRLNPFKREQDRVWLKRNLPRLREKLSRKRAEVVSKLGGKCAKCGYNERPEILQFDHIDPSTKIKTGRVRHHHDRWFGALIRPNVFQILCPNCHAIKTSLQIQSQVFSESAEEYWLRRLGLILEFGASCAHCNYEGSDLVFHFDHRNGLEGEKRQPAVFCVKKNPEAFDLLCANCHAIKTLSDRKKAVS